jgi:DNA replication and repair protein RecF
MYLNRIELEHFRNISRETIEFHKKINIIHGRNGQGKTSVLEAIFYLAITRSFRTKAEKIVLQHNKAFLQVTGAFETDTENRFTVRMYYSVPEGKHLFINKNKVEKFSDLIGRIPVTLLSLEDLELTYGVPANRRKFIDILLSQISPVYLQALQTYKKALAQRNKLLSLIAEQKERPEALFPWDEQLVNNGSELIRFRIRFVEYMNRRLPDYYRKISLKDESVHVKYKINLPLFTEGKEKIEEGLRSALEQGLETDIRRQTTLAGPHRDDLLFYKDDLMIKSYGSQGENKTLLIALKLVECEYLKTKMNESPLLLMDDVFGELDDERIENLLNYVSRFGQTFITTTTRKKFENLSKEDVDFFHLSEGGIIN